MASNLQSQETPSTPPRPTGKNPASPVAQIVDRTNWIEQFVRELVMVDRDFKELSDSGDIVQIRHLVVSKCTVPLLRQI